MILTVTANPTIDRVLFVRNFAMQDMVRAEREVVSPSGKGIDVSLILHALGLPTLAISLNAGHGGKMLAALLAERGLPCELLPAQGETRSAALITDLAQGRQSTIVAPTLTATAGHLDALRQTVTRRAAHSWGLVCAGSLPPGLPVRAWADLLRLGREQGLVTLLDSSGAGLYEGIAGSPHILKINERELYDLAQASATAIPGRRPSHDLAHDPGALGALIEVLGRQLGHWAEQAIVITLGATGALIVTADEALFAPAQDVPVVSAAGAGDAVAAGLMAALYQGEQWTEALRLGMAAAAAVVMNEGTAVCTAEEIQAQMPLVQVEMLPAAAGE